MSDTSHTISLDQAVVQLKAYAIGNVWDPLKMKPPPLEAACYIQHNGFEYRIQLTQSRLLTRLVFQLSVGKIILGVAVPPTEIEFSEILQKFSSKPPSMNVPSPLNRTRQVIWLDDM